MTALLTNPISLKLNKEEIAAIFENTACLFTAALSGSKYDWHDFSRDFHGINPVGGEIRLYQSERVMPPDYLVAIEDETNVFHEYKVDEIERRFMEGATLVVNRFEKYSVLASNICQELAGITENIVLANAYVSKGSSRTFGCHWDRHCVFAVQLMGKKRWKVYRPTLELPLYNQPSTLHKSNGTDPDVPLELILDVILEPGDILYVPRGWWHETSTVDATASLHLSCGVHTPRLHDYLRWILMSKADKKIELRRSASTSNPLESQIHHALEAFKAECINQDNINQYTKEREKLYKRRKLVKFDEFII